MSAIEEVVRGQWTRQKRAFLFPVLGDPECAPLGATVPSTLSDHHVVVNPDFVTRMVGIGADEQTVISAAVARAINRFMRVPRGGFGAALMMYASIRAVVGDAELARRFLDTYFTVWTDLDLYRHRGMANHLIMLYRTSISATPPEKLSNYYRAVVGVLQEKWNVDLGLRHDLFWTTLVAELSQLQYLDSRDHPREAQQFGDALQRYGFKLEEDNTDSQEKPVLWPVEVVNPLGFADIGFGLNVFLDSCDDLGLALLYLDELTRTGKVPGDCLRKSRWAYYDQLARVLNLRIEQRPLAIPEGRVFGVSLKSWEPEDGLQNLAVLSSFAAKVCWPTLSLRWLLTGPESQYSDLDYPDLHVIIDSSGSMIDANKNKSPAVLAAVAAANIYLDHGRNVGVYNFSSSDLVLNPTRDRTTVLRYLSAFQCGGTTLNPQALGALLRQADREVDVLLISDLDLGNWDEAIRAIKTCTQVHRVFVIAVRDTQGQLENFCAALGGKVDACRVDRVEDIPRIVLGSVQESFAQRQRRTGVHQPTV